MTLHRNPYVDDHSPLDDETPVVGRATVTHMCGYNPHGIRITVIMPLEDGYAIPGCYASGGSALYGGGLALQKFSTLENAQTYVQMMHPCTAIRWESMNVAQDDDERRTR